MRLAIALGLIACHSASVAPRDDGTLDVHGQRRHYELFVPTTGTGMPLVIALHGHFGTGKQMERFTRFDEVAAREQFVVAYPDGAEMERGGLGPTRGIDRGWNDGRSEISNGADDVGFIAALIDELAANHGIDRGRVYVTGISNGAMMSYRLACDLGDKIVAIAPVAGNVPVTDVTACHPKAPISVLAINGDADPLVPYAGGQTAKVRGAVMSATASTQLFATADGCGPAQPAVDEPDKDPNDGARPRHIEYACSPPLAVELVTIVGGGHTWPGAAQYLPAAVIGPVDRDFDATERIWQFFVERKPR